MLHTDFSERHSILITNYHAQSPMQQQGAIDAEEDRMDRLGRTLASSVLPYRVRRLGNRRETLPTTVSVQLQSEVATTLKLAAPSSLVLVMISGHGICNPAGEPCLLARDVLLHMKQQGALPLKWFHSDLEAARPAHAVILYDIEFLDGTELDAKTLLQRLPPPAVPCTQIWLSRSALPGQSVLQWFSLAIAGPAVVPGFGCATVRSVLESASFAARAPAHRAPAWNTTLREGDDVSLYTPATFELGYSKTPNSGEFSLSDSRVATLPRGTMLPNRIRVDQVIGRGGFGTVYLGEQVDLHRPVAIKVLLPSASAEPDSVALFLREMWSIARLKHHNIITLYHSGTLPDGQLFYVMEHLSGETLRDRLERQRRLSIDKAIDFTCQLLAGLEHAHGQGVVHRDIKPENLMIVTRPQNREGVVILDFGVARFKEDVAQNSAAGTPGYMRDGSGAYQNDEQADLFSAGVVFFEMLTGSRPDELQGAHPSGALAEAGVPGGIRQTILKAMSQDPSEGFQSAAQFLEALQGTGRDLSDDTARIVRARQPFRSLSPFESEEAHLFFGRDQEIETLLDRLMFSKVLLLMGPSGVGRTSLLRAGLAPRCETAAMRCVQGDLGQPLTELLRRIAPGSPTLRQAVRTAQFSAPRRIALLIDHVEALFLPGAARETERAAFEDQLAELVEDRSLDVCVLLSVREDVLPVLAGLRRRLNLAPSQEFPLAPLGVTAAYHAFSQPLRMARISAQGELIAQLQRDLTVACKELLPLNGADHPHIFPPHLQMAGQALYDNLEPGQNQLTTQHYQQLGRLQGILERHAQNVLEAQVAPSEVPLARRLLMELVAVDGSRQVRADSDLRAQLEAFNAPALVGGVFALLHRHRILQPHSIAGQLHWQLAHEAFAAWVHRSIHSDEAEQKRLRELLMLRVRTPSDEPGFLNSEELDALNEHGEIIEEIDREIAQLPPPRKPRWTVRELVRRSRKRRLVRRWAIFSGALAIALVLTSGFLFYISHSRAQFGDVGVFYLRCNLFDGDWKVPAPASSDEFPYLQLQLLEADPTSTSGVGRPVDAEVEAVPDPGGQGMLFRVSARSGSSRFVQISGRNRRSEAECRASIVPLSRTPGHALSSLTDDPSKALELRIPSCRATRSRTIVVPAGVTLVPPPNSPSDPPQTVAIEEFRIDRLEVSRAELLPFQLWLQGNAEFGISGNPSHPDVPELPHPDLPAGFVDATTARLYCLWWGMDLPTRDQWIKAARGGRTLDGDATALQPNPEPSRRYPWGNLTPTQNGAASTLASAAFLRPSDQPAAPFPVDSLHDGASPYGLLHLSGNVAEWTREILYATPEGWAVGAPRVLAMGGSFLSSTATDLLVGAAESLHPITSLPSVGFRCLEELPGSPTTRLP